MSSAIPDLLPDQPMTQAFPLVRIALIFLGLLIALLGIGFLTLMLGVTGITPAEVVVTLTGNLGEQIHGILVWDVRLPRFLLGALAGAALAVAGAMLQDALRNPLAEPGLLGIASGASLAVAVIVIFRLSIPAGSLPLFALVGGLAAGLVILFATRLTRDPVRMILIGAALAALFGGLITLVVVLGRPQDIQALTVFLVGSLTGRDWSHLGIVAPWLVLGLPVALALARSLNLLQLGDEVAQGLGLAVFRTRILLMLVAIALTASVVAVCGPIGFIALIAPHMVRGLLRTTDARQILPISALLGALLLTSSDLLARELFSPAELPVGLVTVAVGSPVALFLLRRLLKGGAQ